MNDKQERGEMKRHEITATLKDLRAKRACFEGYNRLVRSLQGKVFTDADAERESYLPFKHVEAIPLSHIVESNGLDDALWALRASTATDKDMRLYAVCCARQVAHLSSDPRVKNCLEVAERHAYGKATGDELRAASAAAARAADDAAAARAADDAAAARAAYAAAADDAYYAAWAAAARAAARAADARECQKELFLLMVEGNAPWQ